MGVFYTGKGDKGKSYVGKKSVSKTCLEIEALGQLDELNSTIGVLKSQKISKNLKKILHEIQENLFIIQSHVANIMLSDPVRGPTRLKGVVGSRLRRLTSNGIKVPEFKNAKVKEIETVIDGIEGRLKPLRKFVISGTNQTSSWLDLLRAKSRNAERSVLKIKHIQQLNPDIKSYLNRLSSLFFALGRLEAGDKKEANPAYK